MYTYEKPPKLHRFNMNKEPVSGSACRVEVSGFSGRFSLGLGIVSSFRVSGHRFKVQCFLGFMGLRLA